MQFRREVETAEQTETSLVLLLVGGAIADNKKEYDRSCADHVFVEERSSGH